MICSTDLRIRSQSVTPDFRDSTGQIEKDNDVCALFNQQIIVASKF